jgi:hypothetical protein
MQRTPDNNLSAAKPPNITKSTPVPSNMPRQRTSWKDTFNASIQDIKNRPSPEFSNCNDSKSNESVELIIEPPKPKKKNDFMDIFLER